MDHALSPSAERPDDVVLRHFDRRLNECGDTAQGAYWPNEQDRRTRFDVMLDVIEGNPAIPVVLCDLGCGTGELLAHIRRRGLTHITYIGADRSAAALSYARAKFPEAQFIEIDVNAPDADLDRIACDYLVANGVFTAKFELTHEEMWSFLVSTVEHVWPKVRRGIAFNVMSKVVDWERKDLFHLPMDDAGRLLHRLAGRRVRLRADYGLFEYTAYAYKPRVPASRSASPVPVLRPRLPQAVHILPYLQRIDATRIYTNHGPLVLELEHRLAEQLALPGGGFACASSGTAALIGAILATAGRASGRPLALMPAFTFVATAIAAEQCGYRPYLADIDAETWMLDPERLIGLPILAQIGLIIPVAPFGRPVPHQAWQLFRDKTGIPVVIDGAASFDRITEAPQQYMGTVPVALSFHATKGFGLGEGGGVASTDTGLMLRIVQALNFGFHRVREAEAAGINGKLSEYHAAVGLAELDGWQEKRLALQAVIDCYRRIMAGANLADRFIGAPEIGLSYALFRCRDPMEAGRVQEWLGRRGVDTRLWYGTGLHRQTYFANLSHERLDVTDLCAPCLIGLPMAPDLGEPQIIRITAALTEGLATAG